MKAEKIQLEDDEHILLLVRKHWFVLCLQVISVVIIALLPLAFIAVITRIDAIASHIPFNSALLVTLYTGWLILQWMALFAIWTNYYLDIWIVTNKRLLAVDQRGFFSRTMASFHLDRMQDISVSVNGILQTFLDYGTLEIQTAGEIGQFKVTGIPKPAEIKSTIINASDSLAPKTSHEPHAEV
jgi:hypothetical protein